MYSIWIFFRNGISVMQNIIFEDATLQPPVQIAILCPRNDETPASSKHRRHHLRHILQTPEVQD